MQGRYYNGLMRWHTQSTEVYVGFRDTHHQHSPPFCLLQLARSASKRCRGKESVNINPGYNWRGSSEQCSTPSSSVVEQFVSARLNCHTHTVLYTHARTARWLLVGFGSNFTESRCHMMTAPPSGVDRDSRGSGEARIASLVVRGVRYSPSFTSGVASSAAMPRQLIDLHADRRG